MSDQAKKAIEYTNNRFVELPPNQYRDFVSMSSYGDGYKQGRADAWSWIPVSERLPEFGDRILVLYSGGFLDVLRCAEGRCDDYGRCEAVYTDESDDLADDEFSHWLPIILPGDPK